MTDLQFFISLWERMGTKYYKVDENNAFVTYSVDIENSFGSDVDVVMYCFNIASGKLEDEPYLMSDPSKIEEILINIDPCEQLRYMKILVESLQEKV